jgi:hypothetical protein
LSVGADAYRFFIIYVLRLNFLLANIFRIFTDFAKPLPAVSIVLSKIIWKLQTAFQKRVLSDFKSYQIWLFNLFVIFSVTLVQEYAPVLQFPFGD